MKLVRAGFSLGRDQSGDGVAEFCIVVLRCYLHLRNGIEIRIDHLYALNRILIFRPIDLVARGKRQLSVDLNLFALLWIRILTDAPPDVGRAGREQLEGSEI